MLSGEHSALDDARLVEVHVRRVRAEFSLRCGLDDLRAYAWVGLLEARQRFDPSRGVLFSTYAFSRIRGAVIDGVRTMGWLPRPSVEDVQLEPCGDRPDEVFARVEDVRVLRLVLARMVCRDRLVIEGVHIEERSLDDVGAELGLSKSRVCRLAQNARARLRVELEAA